MIATNNNKFVREITYLGKTKRFTNDFDLLSEDEYKKIVEDWYAKADRNTINEEIILFDEGGVKFSEITDYYFRDVMDDSIRTPAKWSINEVMANRELVSAVVGKIKRNPAFFTSKSMTDNIDSYFRVGSDGTAIKVCQFPPKIVDYILYEYNVNDNYYDYSCGWGARLAGALKNRVNYFGTDPNYNLFDRLNTFASDYSKLMRTKTSVDIRCQGSEVFVDEWKGKMGLAFSSPPYFCLEDYRVGKQSYVSGETSYQDWLDKYLEPTIQNIYEYLTDDGYFVCNIKNFEKYKMESDTVRLSENNGFELYKVDSLKNTKRVSGFNGNNDDVMLDVDENIYVFIKRGATPKQCHPVQLSLFDL